MVSRCLPSFLAVTSSLGHGVADFARGLATRRAPVLRVVAVTATVGLVAVSATAPAEPGRGRGLGHSGPAGLPEPEPARQRSGTADRLPRRIGVELTDTDVAEIEAGK